MASPPENEQYLSGLGIVLFSSDSPPSKASQTTPKASVDSTMSANGPPMPRSRFSSMRSSTGMQGLIGAEVRSQPHLGSEINKNPGIRLRRVALWFNLTPSAAVPGLEKGIQSIRILSVPFQFIQTEADIILLRKYKKSHDLKPFLVMAQSCPSILPLHSLTLYFPIHLESSYLLSTVQTWLPERHWNNLVHEQD